MEDTQLPAWAVVTGNLSSLPAAFEDADVNTKGGRLPHTGHAGPPVAVPLLHGVAPVTEAHAEGGAVPGSRRPSRGAWQGQEVSQALHSRGRRLGGHRGVVCVAPTWAWQDTGSWGPAQSPHTQLTWRETWVPHDFTGIEESPSPDF